MAFGKQSFSFEKTPNIISGGTLQNKVENSFSAEDASKEIVRQLPTFLKKQKDSLSGFQARFGEISGSIELDPLKERVNDEFIKNARMEIPENIREINEWIRKIELVNAKKQIIGSSTKNLLVGVSDQLKQLNKVIPAPWDERKRRVS